MIKYITLICFLVWIFPLGAFIKPSQEKEICNGRRSICLCTHFMAEQKAKLEKIKLLRAKSNPQERASVKSLSSPDFLAKRFDFHTYSKDRYSDLNQDWLYKFFYTKPIEHIPKRFS